MTTSVKASRSVTISNDLGIHLRAAGVLVQIAAKFSSEIWLDRDGTTANAKSIMSVLSLAASKGTELTVMAEGDDAEAAVEAIEDIIQRGFHD